MVQQVFIISMHYHADVCTFEPKFFTLLTNKYSTKYMLGLGHTKTGLRNLLFLENTKCGENRLQISSWLPAQQPFFCFDTIRKIQRLVLG